MRKAVTIRELGQCLAVLLILAQTTEGAPEGMVRSSGEQAMAPTATVVVDAPIYVKVGFPTPLRVAAVGTRLNVIGDAGEWTQVQFQDPQYGLRTGWVATKLIRIDQPNLQPMDLSVREPSQPREPAPATGTPSVSTPQEAPRRLAQPDRGGFTLLLNLGLGIQFDTSLEETAIGLGGLNIGIGGFVTPKLAILGRFSGTNVSYDLFDQVSGVGGATIQYWGNKRVAIEAGAGYGYWMVDDFNETGPGLILGTHFTIFNRGKHNLQLGLEYAPVFTTDPVHNFGITFGYQLF